MLLIVLTFVIQIILYVYGRYYHTFFKFFAVIKYLLNQEFQCLSRYIFLFYFKTSSIDERSPEYF